MPKIEKSAADFMPSQITLPKLKKASVICKGCHLYKNATQTVFGDGIKSARLIIVGEIPGKVEDETGKPFTGPAGTLLHESIDEAGIENKDIYYTNVVKHFKFEIINKRPMHRSPNPAEIRACKPWLQAEIEVIHPQIILCLGSVAAVTLIRKNFRITKERGKWFQFSERTSLLATYHPSAILRAPDREKRHAMRKLFVKDIQKVAHALAITP